MQEDRFQEECQSEEGGTYQKPNFDKFFSIVSSITNKISKKL